MLLEIAKLIKNNQTFFNSDIFPHEELSMRVLLAKERILKLIQDWDENQIKPWSLPELLLQLSKDSRTINEILKQREEKRIEHEQEANLAVQKEQEEQATQSFNPYWNFPIIDDDDEYTFQYKEYLENSSKAITPDLPTEESEDSLIMGDEHLSIIPKKESDEFIKSSVEDLVPILSESEDILEGDSDCDLPSCDDSSPINIPEGNSVTFSNPLFNSNNNFTFSDEESLSDEDVPEDNVKIYSNPLFEFDDEYISSDVNPLFDEVLEDIESDIDEIDAFLDIDISMDVKDGYHDSGGDIIYLERLLINNTFPNLSSGVFLDHEPRSLKDEPNKDGLKSMVKVFDLGIYEKIVSPTYVRLSFEDRLYLSLTYVLRVFLPYFTYLVDSPFLLSSGNEDTIFDPDILAFHFSSLEPVLSHRSGTFICLIVYPNILNESLMEICSSTCFIPNITMILGDDMSNSDELRHTDNTTLIIPILPDTLPQVYHRRCHTLGLLILPSVLPFPPTIRRTARMSILPIEPNLAERARISAINLDDYQLDPVTLPPSPSSPFTMAAY
ncbi:hypothetical protein Tco_0039974 [Tanacetum coccineum]